MSIRQLRTWVTDEALPLWGETGFDQRESQFVEQIGLDGTPLLEVPRRVMVQARQIYVFGLAHERAWTKGSDRLVEAAFGQLIKRYGEDGSQGWAFSTSRSGHVVDDTRDFYAHAFVLLALATVYRLGGDRTVLEIANKTLSFMDEFMKGPVGGYLEALPQLNIRRRQNPHMHLLEALLAWHTLVPDAGFDKRCWSIVKLLRENFLVRIDTAIGLAEYFDENLSPLDGPDFGFEPGHHFEWVWLLEECERVTGLGDSEVARSLFESAARSGFRSDGAIFDEVSLSGRVVKQGVRLWPLTEALKAWRSGFAVPKDCIIQNPADLSSVLLSTFLKSARSGLWNDQFNEKGHPIRDSAPASSLYHICCAVAQYCNE